LFARLSTHPRRPKAEAFPGRIGRRLRDGVAKCPIPCSSLCRHSRKGDAVWHEIEAQVKRRNASGYDKAAALLLDLQTIAKERRTTDDFTRRLSAIRERHARKERFIQRLRAMG